MQPDNCALTHAKVDERIYRLVCACVHKIDQDSSLLLRARKQLEKWENVRLRKQWETLLELPWPELKTRLQERNEHGDQMRQSVPFGGFLSVQERMRIIKGL